MGPAGQEGQYRAQRLDSLEKGLGKTNWETHRQGEVKERATQPLQVSGKQNKTKQKKLERLADRQKQRKNPGK